MKKVIFSSVLVGVLAVGFWALAEDKVPATTNAPSSPSVRAKMKEQKDLLNKEVRDSRKNIKKEVKDKKAEVENEIKNLKEDVQKKTQEFKDTVKAKRAELQDQIKAKREELRANLKKIKDASKQQSVENIDKQLDDLNSQTMTRFSDMLDKMSAVLVRTGDRVNKASQRGYDVSSVRLAIDNANKAIATARSAIVAQTGKTYVIKITSENGLKGSVGKARDSLHADLAVVKNAVQAANEAVRKVAVVLGQLKGQNLSPSPSLSPSVSPTPVSTSSPQTTPAR